MSGGEYEPRFARPEGWEPLGEDGEAPEPVELAPESDDWVAPGPPAKRAMEAPRDRRVARAIGVGVIIASVLVVAVFGWGVITAPWSTGLSLPGLPRIPEAPERPERPVPEAGDLEAHWYLQAHDLRPELEAVEFEIHHDGLMDSSTVIDAGEVWGVITFDWHGGGHVVHGIDSSTGEEVWSRPMEGAYCASQLMEGDLVCAEALEREGDLGTKWRLTRLAPQTGEVVKESTIDAWIATMTVHHDVLIILEQRQPAPHAVVRGFDTTLQQAWSHDLSSLEAHEYLFSESRSILRDEQIPDGPALMNPRVRMMSNETTALWIYGATAFIDAQAGKLRAMLPCSRPVDDGERIWCSYGGMTAVAHSYDFKPLYKAEQGLDLAFPARDPKYGDVMKPLFLREDGVAMKVDLATGKTVGKLVDTTMGEAFGLAIDPQVAYAGGHMIVHDMETAVLVDAETYTPTARLPEGMRIDQVFFEGGKLINADYTIQYIDPATGQVSEAGRNIYGFTLARADGGFYSYSLDEVARVKLP